MAVAQPLVIRSRVTPTSWSPGSDLHPSEWIRCGRWLGTLGRGWGWWIGDWVRHGNARFGERYELAARVTGYDVQTLMNMAYVASRFEFSRRREDLSFSHHAELAALPQDEQDRWLELAATEDLSVRALRGALRQTRVSAHRERLGAGSQAVTCPSCGHRFPSSGAPL